MDSPYRRELEVVIGALQLAARLSQHIIHSSPRILEKDDLSPVTVADFAIQALLCATIQKEFPGDHVVGEENASELRADLLLLEHVYQLLRWSVGRGDGGERDTGLRDCVPGNDTGFGPAGDNSLPASCAVPDSREHMCSLIDECGSSSPSRSGRVWVFDPIDGTKTYVRGELYAINVALLVDGVQTVGVIACPNLAPDTKGPLNNNSISTTGTIVFAVKGSGAYKRPLAGSIHEARSERLSHHESNLELKDVRFITSATIVDSALEGIHEAIAARINVQFPGSDLLPWVLRWVGLAMGHGNTTVWVYKEKHRRAKVWDHAGAMLMFEETGGLVTDVHGKAIDLTAGRKLTGNFGFVAAPVGLHCKVLGVVRAVVREKGYDSFLEDGRTGKVGAKSKIVDVHKGKLEVVEVGVDDLAV